ncbi:hypothetical protein [Xanthomonas sacchari]|uniref:hypothetical protein n=1 Tax=Xanthomonas sacchari TaxID=56458 RepID=UPI00224E52DB|nr:hypothetical protein [Xanthomonas sacchari]
MDQQVRTYRAVRGLRDVHGRARGALPASAYDAYFSHINTFASEMLRQVPLKGYSNVAALVEMPALPLEEEVLWNVARIKASASEINDILKLARSVEECVWKGNCRRAFALMDEIAGRFGESLWLIEKRIFLHQFDGGLRAQKAYVAKVKSILRGGVAPFLAHHISVRNEPSTSVSRFVSDVKVRCERIKDKELGAYLEHRLARQWPSDEDSISNILRVEQNNATIDVYETFLSFVLAVRAGAVAAAFDIEKYAGVLSDIEDSRLSLELGGADFGAGKEMALDFCKGRYAQVVGANANAKYPSLEGVLLTALCRAQYEPIAKYEGRRHNSLASIIVSRLSEGLKGGAASSLAIADLEKTALNYHDSGLVDAISRVASVHIFDDLSVRSVFSAIPPNLRSGHFFDQLSTDGDIVSTLTRVLGPLASGKDGVLGADMAMVFAACEAESGGDGGDVMLNLLPLLTDKRDVYSNLAYSMGIEIASKKRDVKVFLTLLAEAIVRFGAIILSPRAEGFASNLRWQDVKSVAQDIRVAIASHYLLRNGVGKNWGSNLRFSIDAFLDGQGVKLPSEVDRVRNGTELVTYFWRIVCEQKIVDMIRSVHGVRALRMEMRAIYSELRSVDPGNIEFYDSEIVLITHSLMIEEGRKIVDQSRIYVDEAAIREGLKKDLAEPFSRYRALAPATANDSREFDDALRRAAKGNANSGDLTFPTSEADQLLIDMIGQSCSRFLLDPVHGLDSYLSKRIRHGSIVGHLRGAIEQHRVIYQSRGDIYTAPAGWLDEFANIDDTDQRDIVSAMADFSRSVDAELIYTKNNVVQIRSADKQHGLLGVNLSPADYHTIRSVVRVDLSYEGFLTSMFATFWGLLNPSLDVVKRHLRERTALSLSAEFSKARSSVGAKRIKYPQLTQLLTGLEQAGRDVLAELESVSQWFERSGVHAVTRSYKLSDAVSIGVESSKAAYKGALIDIKEQLVQDFKITVVDIPVLADVLLVTLGNIYTKSGVSGVPWAKLSASVDRETGVLIMKINSEVGKGVLESAGTKVASIRDDIREGRIEQSLRKEGESGLKKLASIVKQSQQGSLDFGFVSEVEFFVEVRLSLVLLGENGP